MDNRNIYGFALFTFIVISTVITSYVFFAPANIKVAPPPQVFVKETTYSCRSKAVKSASSQKIEQAVLDLDTKVLDVNLNFGNQFNYSSENGVAVALHFYTKSPQPKKIGVETVWFKPNSINAYERSYGKYRTNALTVGTIRKACSYSWTSQLRENQSVYVIAKVAPTMSEAKELAVEFNESEAAPVLLYTDK